MDAWKRPNGRLGEVPDETDSFRVGSHALCAAASSRGRGDWNRLKIQLDVLPGHLTGEVLRGTHRQRENRHCGVLPSGAGKAGAIYNEQILVIMALTPFVQDTVFRIVPHAARAHLVDAVARRIGYGVF